MLIWDPITGTIFEASEERTKEHREFLKKIKHEQDISKLSAKELIKYLSGKSINNYFFFFFVYFSIPTIGGNYYGKIFRYY